jgi:hypothetical protein
MASSLGDALANKSSILDMRQHFMERFAVVASLQNF